MVRVFLCQFFGHICAVQNLRTCEVFYFSNQKLMKVAAGLSRYFLLLFLIASLLQGCSSDDPGPDFTIEVLESADKEFTRAAGEAQGLVRAFAGSELADKIVHDVTFYEISYKTNYKGQEIVASGLVAFPETDQPVPMVSFQNGTNTVQSEAPTSSNTFKAISGLAGAGYIICIPDYIGFGVSSDIFHPYYDYQTTAESVVDMIKATRELAFQEGYAFDNRLFLSGYSQGGYATMSAHKYIEENEPFPSIELVASTPSSGGYDVKGVQEYFFEQTTYPQPYYLAYIALAYQDLYEWEQPLSVLFQEPYATRIPGLFDGVNSGGVINGQLSTTISEFIQPDILANIDTDPEYNFIVEAFESNSVDEWVPNTRMFMFHGNADDWVPYQNSVDTYNRMIQLGASESTLTFTTLEGATHGSGFLPYLQQTFDIFEDLK